MNPPLTTFTDKACISAFDRIFSPVVQQALILAVREAAREAAEVYQSKRVRRAQRKQTQAGLRRAILETKLREIAEQYGLDDAHDLVHEGQRSANLVIRHGVIALTQKYNKLDPARYRETLARMSAETLFAVHKEPAEGDMLFAVLNYTLDELDQTGGTVATVEIIFPAPMGRVPVGRIDLLSRIAAIEESTEAESERVEVKTKGAAAARRAARKGKKEA